MSAQTFTINNTSPSTITVVKFVFDTPNTIGHEFNLSNFGGSSSFSGTQYNCNTTIASSSSKTFTANYSNLVSAPGTFTAKIFVTLDTEEVLELTASIVVEGPSQLPYYTELNPVTSVTPIFAEFYNTLRNQVNGLLGDYGYSGMVSRPVAAGNIIKLEDWVNLVSDFQHTYVHQNNTITPLDGTSSDAVNDLILSINQSYTNSSTVATAQLSSATITDSRINTWTGTILHSSTLTWTTSADMHRYFLLGGKLTSRLGYTGSDSTWSFLLSVANNILRSNQYDWSEYIGTTSTLWAKNNGSNFIWSSDPTSMVVGSNVSQGVFLNVTRNTNSIDYHLGLLDADPLVHSILPTHTMTYYYSVGDRPINGYSGIAAPRPTTKTDTSFQQDITPPGASVPNSKKLTVSLTSSTFTFTQATYSYYSIVTVNNSGNQPVSITGITYTTNGVIANADYTGDFAGSPVHVIFSGTSHTYALRYIGATPGFYSNSFTVNSDNDTGPITTLTYQNVTSPSYYFTVSPPSINVVRTSSEYVSALLTINEFNGDYFNGPGTYTANLTGTNASSFILSDSTLLGPTIAFDPTGQTNPQGYSCYVNITITGTTVVVPITLELDIPSPSLSVNENLGSWLSPIQKNNGVIGFSYDIIANKRYLTIGFGTGADGSLEITNGTAKTGNYALVTNLDYDADSRVAESDGKFPVVIYAAETDSGSGSFFKDYAVWIRSSDAATAQSEPRGIDVSRTFKFTVPTTGDYVLTSSIDYSASVIIDDAEVFTGSNSYGSSEETTIALDQGSHTITWILTGDRLGPTGVALQLKRSSDNLEIWNTRYTTRNTTPYLNWAEIYRIPIKANGTAQTLLSSDYLVKSWQFLGGLRYGQYFKDDNILSVVDDGTGDLTITFNPDLSLTNTTSDPTITSASELFYYYSTKSVRVENLSSAEGDGTQTRWFRGFTKDGVVKTSLQNYPGSPTGSSGSNTNIPINNGNQNQEQ